PGVALNDYGQAHGHGLANAPRARLSDEKVGQMHVVGDFGSEAFDETRSRGAHTAKGCRELLIAPANENELGIREPLGDLHHHTGALATEQYQASRTRRVEAELGSFRASICRNRIVEFRTKNHAGDGEDPVRGV